MKKFFTLAALLLPFSAQAQQMNYQGRLTDANGIPRPGPQVTVTFSLWDAPTDGEKVWGDFARNVDLIDGNFSIKLGDLNGGDDNTGADQRFLPNVFTKKLYLQIQLAEDQPLPRQEILSSPVAFSASLITGPVRTEHDLRDAANRSTRLYFDETADATKNFGFSLAYMGRSGTVFDGTSFPFASNTFHVLRHDNNDAGAPALSIKRSDGNVGIGIQAPTQKLDVAGNARVSGDLNVTGNVTAGTITGTLTTPSLSLDEDLTVAGDLLVVDKSEDVVSIKSNTNNSLEFRGQAIDSSNELRINWFSDEPASIGDGSSRLNVNSSGAENTTLFVKANAGHNSPIRVVTHNDEQLLRLQNIASRPENQKAVLDLFGAATKTRGGTSWEFFSDARLKKDIKKYQSGLSEILALETVSFRYKNNDSLGLHEEEENIGFIAQDVQKVIPEAISKTESGYLSLNADPIHWASVNAIQELNTKLESQKQTIATQEAEKNREIEELKKENADLAKRLLALEEKLAE